MNKVIVTAAALLCYLLSSAQEQWNLQRCIDYAVTNNIQIKQAELATQNQEIILNTSKLAYLPDLNAGVSQNFSFGRATGNDNVIVNQSQANTGLNASTTIPLFTGMRNLNQIYSNKLNLKAAISDLQKAKEDLSLNVTAYYLQVLYADALLQIAKEQLTLSNEQVERTQVLVDNGKVSESELYEAKAQQAVDNQSVTEANNTLQLAKLDLCQLLNYEQVDAFALEPVDPTSLMPSDYKLSASPSEAYNYSLSHRPAISAAQERLESSEKSIRIAQSYYYPQLSLSASYGTGYYHNYNYNNPAFGQQFRENGSEVVGISLSIPIFNRMATTNGVKQARIAKLNYELELESAKQTLLKEIQNAYYNALAAKDKYLAATETARASRIAFQMEEEKYNGGKSTAFDYSTAKTRLQKADAEAAQAQFEYIFRSKIFDFYNGASLI